MDHRKQGYRFPKDWDEEYLENSLKTWGQAVTLPVNVEVKAEHRVLSMENARRMLDEAELIVRMNCVCRTTYNNCDSPFDNCISINDRAKMILETERYKDRNMTC